MLIIRDLCKSFGQTKVLDQINLELEDGKIHGIIGRNGSGKSVLFKCICGLLPYDSGTIELNGKTISFAHPQLDKIGALIESPGFLEDRSGLENLKFLAQLSGSKTNPEQYMNLVGLDPTSKKHVGKYSLGMKQRLGIAQALMEQHPYLILDEPMNSLDESGIELIREILRNERQKGTTILIASHYKEDIEILCDTVFLMRNGKLIPQ